MDIHEKYQSQSILYLNTSIFILIPAFLYICFVITFYNQRELMLLVLPFVICSMILFQYSLINKKRYIETTKRTAFTINDSHASFTSNHLLLWVDRNEDKVLFYHPSGQLVGEIIQIKKRSFAHPSVYIMRNDKDKLLATYYKNPRSIDVFDPEHGLIGSYYFEIEDNGVFQNISGVTVGKVRAQKWLLDDKIESGSNMIMRIRRGWMPFKSLELFRNPNTPNINVYSKMSNQDRLIYLAYIIRRFC